MAASSLIPRLDLVWGEPGNEASQFSCGITLNDFTGTLNQRQSIHLLYIGSNFGHSHSC